MVSSKTKSQWSCGCLIFPELRCHLKKRTSSSTRNQTKKDHECQQKLKYTNKFPAEMHHMLTVLTEQFRNLDKSSDGNIYIYGNTEQDRCMKTHTVLS